MGIVVLDDHLLRGDAVAALLSQQAGGSGLGLIHVDAHQVAGGCSLLSSDEVAACIYIIGGWSIDEPQVRLTLKRCLAVLEKRPLIVLADEVDGESIAMAVTLGVRGVIPTYMTSSVALAAIQFILAGGHYFPHSVPQVRSLSISAANNPLRSTSAPSDVTMLPDIDRDASVRPPRPDGSGEFDPGHHAVAAGRSEDERHLEVQVGDRTLVLTPRQIDVIRWLERGLSNKAIGKELDLSESTVKLHVRHLLRKLKVTNRTQVALLARSALQLISGSNGDSNVVRYHAPPSNRPLQDGQHGALLVATVEQLKEQVRGIGLNGQGHGRL